MAKERPSWLSWLVPGNKVVCTAQFKYRPGEEEDGVKLPLMFMTYTIRDVTLNPTDDQGVQPCIRLNEIINPVLSTYLEPGETSFWYAGFAPLVEDRIEADLFAKLKTDSAPRRVDKPSSV